MMSTDDTTPLAPQDSAGAYPLGTPDTSSTGMPIKPPLGSAAPGQVTGPVDPPRHRLRVGTAVWGLVIAIVGVGVIAMASGAVFDLQLALIALLAVAGVAMLVGSIVSGVRRRNP
jgi:hypothetical protein